MDRGVDRGNKWEDEDQVEQEEQEHREPSFIGFSVLKKITAFNISALQCGNQWETILDPV